MNDPDYIIYIGIKNEKVIMIDWHLLPHAQQQKYKKSVIKYLKQAINYMEKQYEKNNFI